MTIRKQQEDTRPDRKTLWFLGAAIVVLFLLWVMFAPGRGLFHYLRLNKEIAALSEENVRLEAKNTELLEDINRLRSDDKYLEEVARKKHGLLRKNETVFEFEPPKKKKE
ncbi:septum formation initiator family protein [Desulfobulbus sp.]|uniref:FtsB family cell division protein n=1 Tax=Desulfobulbus sp. TaxID=895 RepID=UPI00286F969A|nr:septum formation initiator family protein [Desulfobulbus sp.]